ncbi:hypothetical protein BDN72DRAFT_87519 [Pluteus cervinus]|uniref:Uncharacterized protein n=1 Tax=Pluteus cervinus TaxID=181527 RepID=A0ACD2ZY92_9AGAR|nr:hypothetical protein BDN72DRAFT_87519 [Pluteus cervinus]
MSFPGQPTTNTLSHPTPPSSNSKRPADYDERTQPAPKRVHLIVNEGAQNIPPIAGSGPFTPGAVRPSPPQHPAFSKFGSRRSKTNSGSSNVASDVWWFMYPVPSKERPAENARAPPDFQPLKARPRNTPIMACRLCTGDEWRVWKCDDGRTSRVREHLEKDHWAIYYEQVMQHKLKGWETLPERAREANRPVISSNTREPFTLEGFYQRLVKWMAASDQASSYMNSTC